MGPLVPAASGSPVATSTVGLGRRSVIFVAASRPGAIYELVSSMRSFVALILLLITFWQVTGDGIGRFDLATATLSVAAAWFVSLFIAD